MRVLITGAAGFIGSHLVERFLKDEHQVVGVDNLITGRMKNLEHIENEDFKFYNADVIDGIPLCENIEGVLHFASPASPVDFKKIPLEILDANSIGTRNCIEFALENGAKFMFASTSEIYGDPLIHPQPEDYYGNVNPNGLRSVYDESKRFSEAMTYAFKRNLNLEARVVRIFNTYGPRMRPDDGRVIPDFINNALRDKPVNIYGDGSRTRSFCYISDTIEGIYRLFMSDYSEPINIGNPDEYRIIDLIGILEEIIGKKIKINFKPQQPDDPKKRKPDIKRAKEILNWEPEVRLREGLRKTVESFI